MVIADLPGAANAARRMLDDLDNQYAINVGAINQTPDQLRQNLLEQASKLGKVFFLFVLSPALFLLLLV
jgi:hypothetical protein